MKHFFGICAFVTAIFPSILPAQTQTGFCGNGVEDQKGIQVRLEANKAALEQGLGVSDRDVIQYVPIHFHMVGSTAGVKDVLEGRILDQLCDLNYAYAPMDIRFYLEPHPTFGLFDKTINNDNVNSQQTNILLMQNKRHQHAINVFLVDEPVSGNNTSGQTLAYYSTIYDWIVERNKEVEGGYNGTLPHEVGHLFSLMHTFYGYEPDFFNAGDAGWPVAPSVSPGGIQTERMNGTNCSTAGDGVCDTPPDYFGYVWNSCTQYAGGAKDPLGVLVDPMENNFMGYFPNCGINYAFTPMQQSLILADLASPQRNYLDNSFSPVSTDITVPSNLLVAPIGGANTPYYDEVMLEWQPVGNAQWYLVEVDVLTSFGSPLNKNYVTTGTSQLVLDLLKNKTYYWRVRPFNQYVTCADNPTSTFKTSTVSATNDITGVDAWQISPNPLQEGNSIRLGLTATESLNANVKVVDATGRVLYAQNGVDFPAGETQMDIPVEGIANGFYLVTLENEQGRDVRKLVVAKQ